MEDENLEERTPDISGQLNEILLVLDKIEKKISAVKEIDKDGGLKKSNVEKKNQAEFMRVDMNGDAFTNFFTNFLRQLKDPTRFSFLKVPLNSVFEVAEKLQAHIHTPTKEGEELFNKYQAKETQEHQQKKVNTMETTTTTTTEAKVTAPEPGGYRYKAEDIDWSSLTNLGWTREELEETNLLNSLLRGYKTNDLLPITIKVGEHEIETDAKLWLEAKNDGRAEFKFLCKKNEIDLDTKFLGHDFTQEDKANLLERGNMGRIVNLLTEGNKEVPHLISLDEKTNQLVSFPVSHIQIDDVIKGVTLSAEQKNTLLEGKPIYLEGMMSKRDNLFDGEIQFNAFKGHLEFFFDKNQSHREKQGNTQADNQQIPKSYRRKEFTYDQYNKLAAGQTVYIPDFKDAGGQAYPGFVSFNKETGQMDFSFKDPDKFKRQAATNKLQEPLKPGQQTPQDANQKQEKPEKKSRGRKV
ncbi:DUF3945 domain-containing protein [Chryseobacterium sp. 22543]|uniref:DUF3945 domain-containing protein n=1 Tax=Chryseobacterium sp. 22543 TaxID=3453940 RepID=UPI003F87C14C